MYDSRNFTTGRDLAADLFVQQTICWPIILLKCILAWILPFLLIQMQGIKLTHFSSTPTVFLHSIFLKF
jgi:hypothetical protein